MKCSQKSVHRARFLKMRLFNRHAQIVLLGATISLRLMKRLCREIFALLMAVSQVRCARATQFSWLIQPHMLTAANTDGARLVRFRHCTGR